MELSEKDLHYLRLLSKEYPSVRAASTAIIELQARLNLPKGTEHFISDIHGEYEAFHHLIKNGSGSIRRRINEIFTILSPQEKRDLATLIYYPEQKISLILRTVENKDEWFRMTLLRLIKLGQNFSSKYTRADVRGYLKDEFAVIIEELLYGREDEETQREYYECILDTIIATNTDRMLIVAMAELIQKLAVSRLHVIGDVYDRGPGAERVMDTLMEYHDVDIQWGNHDILWMGAASGSEACLTNVIRIALRYGNTETLENGYGISLLPLASFAIDVYGDDPSDQFLPKTGIKDEEFTEHELRLLARMHKAITIIQLKLEAQIIQRRPHFLMDDRLLLDKVDYEAGTVDIEGTVYPLTDSHFPTIDPANPYQLTEREQGLVDRLRLSFAHSRRLQQHIRFLFSKGGMYLTHNGNLLYHGCIAMHEDGSFMEAKVAGQSFAGKAFMDRLERLARQGYFATDDPKQKQYGMDAIWYLWSGPISPLYGKVKMTTFERYFIADKATHAEQRNAYYDLRNDEATARKILAEFGLDPDTGHIVNGHVPVKVKQGESPVKAGGKLLVIDGGFAKAYQQVTGIAGYTLVFNSYGLLLAAHQPFESAQKAIEGNVDMGSQTQILETNSVRIRVRDTDEGKAIQQQIDDLRLLLKAYRDGLIKES